MEMGNVRAVATLLGLGVLSYSSGLAVTEEQYASRCAAAQSACTSGDTMCANWRDAFNQHGSVCPGVNGPSSARMHGPVATSNEPSEPTRQDGDKPVTMSDIKDVCSSANGHHGFIEQTQCVQLVMTRSNNPDLVPSNPYIGLYNLEAEKLIDDVQRHRISVAGAEVELQKTYLDVLARQSAANESAARVQAIQQQQEQEREGARQQQLAEQQRVAAEERQRQQAERDQEAQEATQQADIARIRRDCVKVMMAYNNNHPGVSGIDLSAYALCDSDPYAHLRPENRPARHQVNCTGMNGMVNCTEQ